MKDISSKDIEFKRIPRYKTGCGYRGGGRKKRSGTVSHFSASVTDILIANVRKIFLSILFQFVFLRITGIEFYDNEISGILGYKISENEIRKDEAIYSYISK